MKETKAVLLEGMAAGRWRRVLPGERGVHELLGGPMWRSWDSTVG